MNGTSVVGSGKFGSVIRSLQERHFFKQLADSLAKRGLIDTFIVSYSALVEYLFDLRYGTDTISWVEKDDLGIDPDQKKHAVLYQPSPSVPVRQLLAALDIPRGKVFVDLGCGKGKVLLIASEFDFDEVRGVELSAALCEIARSNAWRYKQKKEISTPILVIQSDVLDYSIEDDEDVFYMFNPFDAYVLDRVIVSLLASLQRRKRKIWIIYRDAHHKETILARMKPSSIFLYTFRLQDFMVMEFDPESVPRQSLDPSPSGSQVK